MNKNTAIEFAKEHILKKNKENTIPNFNWIITNPIETEISWFFNYEYKLQNQNMNVAVGGAPGFIVKKENGKIIDVSWEELRNLNISG